jgi:hypothetical protein
LAAALAALASLARGDYVTYDSIAFNAGAFGSAPNRTFRSTSIIAPLLLANKFLPRPVAEAEPDPYIFLAGPYEEGGAFGPVVLSATDLSLVYADCSYPYVFSSDVQTLPDGSRALVFWEGRSVAGVGFGRGRVRVYNEAYTLLYDITLAEEDSEDAADMHEAQITQDGTMIMSFYGNTTLQTSGIDDCPAGLIMADSGFKEIDLSIGEVVFQWMAADHFDPVVSYARCTEKFGGGTTGWDWFHINSVQKVRTAFQWVCEAVR